MGKKVRARAARDRTKGHLPAGLATDGVNKVFPNTNRLTESMGGDDEPTALICFTYAHSSSSAAAIAAASPLSPSSVERTISSLATRVGEAKWDSLEMEEAGDSGRHSPPPELRLRRDSTAADVRTSSTVS